VISWEKTLGRAIVGVNGVNHVGRSHFYAHSALQQHLSPAKSFSSVQLEPIEGGSFASESSSLKSCHFPAVFNNDPKKSLKHFGVFCHIQ